MLGFIFGTACLFGVFLLVWHGSPRLSRRPFSRFNPGRVSGDLADALVDTLHASPAQETTIRQSVDGLLRATREARRKLRRARAATAHALRTEPLDAEAMSEAVAQSRAAYESIQEAALQSFTQVHAVLEPEQRKRLAELISTGTLPAWTSPYRSPATYASC